MVLLVHEYAVPVATQGYEAYRAETETWGDAKRAAEATADALTSEVADLKATMAAMEVCEKRELCSHRDGCIMSGHTHVDVCFCYPPPPPVTPRTS
jgi:hypothetical protein